MNVPHGLLAALRQKRAEEESTVSTGSRVKYSDKPGLEAKLDALDEKLDRILAYLEQGPEKEEINVTRNGGT